ncbi:hypothetical protein [Nocardioides sp. GY 10113]|uniref:hypothetical protein n=1 Tax=Nocardioides sp. GY 10113 TaxID=2569761 RepID=UPI0014588F03|nr:hypothetical protein [Nocardioides sp. GY 10113]
MNNDAFYRFEGAELEYRRSRTRREFAGHRGQSSRTSWLRRLAAADPDLARKQD